MTLTMAGPKVMRPREYKAAVHCPLCTHTVNAVVTAKGKNVFVTPGQKCPRCSSSLDAAYVLRVTEAA